MGRFLAGVASAMLLMAAGLLFWKSDAGAENPIPPPPAAAGAAGPSLLADPPAATEKTREEKRFGRYDKDKDGAITRDEYLASRRKAYAKLDTNSDGRLSFEEWSAKTSGKFATADADRSGILTPTEFATTRVVRKSKPRPECPPTRREDDDG
jgi:hypothetical protein